MTVFSKSHQGKEQEEGMSKGGSEKTERELSMNNTSTLSRLKNELIGEFKITVGDVISVRR